MKSLFLAFSLFFCLVVKSQTWIIPTLSGGWVKPNNNYGTVDNRLDVIKFLGIPTTSTIPTTLTDTYDMQVAGIAWCTFNHSLYVYKPETSTWDQYGIGSVPTLINEEVAFGDPTNQMTSSSKMKFRDPYGLELSDDNGNIMALFQKNSLNIYLGDVDGAYPRSYFQIDNSGFGGSPGKFTFGRSGTISIHEVPYEFPTSQGITNTFLKNDGSGNLSWISLGLQKVIDLDNVLIGNNTITGTGKVTWSTFSGFGVNIVPQYRFHVADGLGHLWFTSGILGLEDNSDSNNILISTGNVGYTGSLSTFIGGLAGRSAFGQNNIGLGKATFRYGVGNYNNAIGSSSLSDVRTSYSVGYGNRSGRFAQRDNSTSVGYASGQNAYLGNNVSIGTKADNTAQITSATLNSSEIVYGTKTFNGSGTASFITASGFNIGDTAVFNNTFDVADPLAQNPLPVLGVITNSNTITFLNIDNFSISDYSGNVLIRVYNKQENSIAIGYNVQTDASNHIQIGNSTNTKFTAGINFPVNISSTPVDSSLIIYESSTGMYKPLRYSSLPIMGSGTESDPFYTANGVPKTRLITNGYAILPIGDLTINRTISIDSATLSSYYPRRKDSSINGGYYPYSTNPKNYLQALYDNCGKLIGSDFQSVLLAGSFTTQNNTIDLGDNDFTWSHGGKYTIDVPLYLNKIDGSATADSVLTLNQNNKVKKVPNGGQYWTTIDAGVTLNQKGNALTKMLVTVPFFADSITANSYLQVLPGFPVVSFNMQTNAIKFFTSAGYFAYKLNKAGSDTFMRKDDGVFTADRAVTRQDKNGTMTLWNDNISHFTNDAGYLTTGSIGSTYLQTANNFSEIIGGNKTTALTNLGFTAWAVNMIGKATPSSNSWIRVSSDASVNLRTAGQTRTDLGATTVGENVFLLTNPSVISWMRINTDNTITTRTSSQTLADLGATGVGTNILGLTNPSAISWIRINADNTVNSRTAAQTISDLGAENALTISTGLTRTGNTITDDLATGKAGGLTVTGGTAASENLKLRATSDATKGYVGIVYSPTATANYASFSVGGGGNWDGTAGSFVGSVNGTQIGVNSTSGFSGNLIDLQKNGVPQFRVDNAGIITNATYNGNLVTGTYGGTGVNNGSSTITLGGNLITSGAFATTITSTATTNSTLPSGTHSLAGLDVANVWTVLQEHRLTTEQLRLSYDASNYASFTVASTGQLTISNTASSANGAIILSGGLTTNSTSTSANLAVMNAGTIFNVSNANARFFGVNTDVRILSRGSTNSTLTLNDPYVTFGIGSLSVTEASSGTHPAIVMGLGIRQGTVTNGTATTTDLTSFYIEGAPTGITPTNPSTAMWVAAGTSRFDGGIQLGSTGNSIASSYSGSATLDFASTLAGAATDLTITVTGAVAGDVVLLGVPDGSTLSDGNFTAWVSATNTVKVRFANNSLTLALDPASGTFNARVFH